MFFTILFLALVLLAVTVSMHVLGLSFLIRFLMKKAKTLKKAGMRANTSLLIILAWWLLLIHSAEIAVWGLYYYWQGCFADIESAFYFSGITYTTVGYGDLVLPAPWRMLAPTEAMAGILMCGLSTGLFFAVIRWLLEPYINAHLRTDSGKPPATHG
jgi:hypothetical protein